MPVSLCDAVRADESSIRRTRDGYLVADVRMARSGIYDYAGAELGDPSKPLVRVYRPEDEVFKTEAMASFAFRPMTNDHPTEQVSAENWKDVAVGMIGGEVARDGSYVRVPLVMMDKGAIEAFEGGKRELSAGYTCDIEWTSGSLDDGTPYDAIQRNIRGNHLALVERGRAGPECRIGDGAARHSTPTQPATVTGERVMPDDTLRTVVVDGLTIACTPQSAEVINKLQAQLGDATKATDTAVQRALDAEKQHNAALVAKDGQIAAMKAAHDQALAAKDGEIAALRAGHEQALAAKDGEIAALRTQTSDEALEARVTARAVLVGNARRLVGDSFDPSGKSDAEVRKLVVTSRMGDKLPTPDEKDADTFYRHAFDTLVAMAPAAGPARPDPMRQITMAGAGTVPAGAMDTAGVKDDGLAPWQRAAAVARDAWKS